jgi:hypothetical protein
MSTAPRGNCGDGAAAHGYVRFTRAGEAALDTLASRLAAEAGDSPEGIARVLGRILRADIADLAGDLAPTTPTRTAVRSWPRHVPPTRQLAVGWPATRTRARAALPPPHHLWIRETDVVSGATSRRALRRPRRGQVRRRARPTLKAGVADDSAVSARSRPDSLGHHEHRDPRHERGRRDQEETMSQDAAPTEDALEEEARRHALEIAASEDASAQAVAERGSSPDEEIAQVRRSGRQHDLSDTAPYHRPQVDRRIRVPRR